MIGIGICQPIYGPIARAITDSRGASTLSLTAQVQAIFAGGAVGGMWDPSDLTTMYQDVSGQSPVTTAAQTVSQLWDKSLNLALGSDTGTDFSSGAGWTLGTNITIAAGKLSFAAVASGQLAQRTGGTLYLAARVYELVVVVDSISGGTINVSAANTLAFTISAPGTYTAKVAGAANNYLSFVASTGTVTASIDSVTVRQVTGSHFIQATAGLRPQYQTAVQRIDFDGVDDTMTATFPSSLGAACTVVRSVPGVGASILTAQSIGTTYADTTDHSGLLIFNRALTGPETVTVTAWADARGLG